MRTALVQQHFGKRRRDVVIRFHVVAECLESPREISDSQRGRSHVDAAAARAEIHRDTSDSNARQRASWTVVVMFMRPRPRDGSAAERKSADDRARPTGSAESSAVRLDAADGSVGSWLRSC